MKYRMDQQCQMSKKGYEVIWYEGKEELLDLTMRR